ncbi:MAG: hypothetical protein PF638_02835 [Candidatus Delongbacteria bacterium]|jgi:predicted outer membrane repeat protein|nr:hypothetical protein [Candidatus Delongbacteria bacterium]
MKKFLSMLLLSTVLSLFSATHYIDSLIGNDLFAGTEISPWKTISYGISQAAATDTIMLSGTFLLTWDGGSTTEGIEITKSLTFIGEGAKSTFVKAASTPGIATSRVFQVITGSIVTMENLSIENGVGLNGGGILNNGTLTLGNVNISSNQATNSGGGISSTGTLNLTNTTIRTNSALNSGGGISGNYRVSTGFSIENCTISGNQTTATKSIGGGINLSALYIRRNVIVTAGINSSTIAENTTIDDIGNGINIRTMDDIMYSSTIIMNISNSIVSNGTSGNYNKDISSGGSIVLNRSYTLCSDASMPNGSSDGNIDSTDPLLDPLADNGGQTLTHAVPVISPLVDAIPIEAGTEDYNGAPVNDQRGRAINRDGKDIGSFEYQGSVIFYVNDDTGSDSNTGLFGDPWKTISHSVLQLANFDTLDVTGTFYLNEDAGNTAEGIVVSKSMTIQGQGADVTKIGGHEIKGSAETRLFYIDSLTTVKIKDIHLLNGLSGIAGGILNYSELTIENVELSDCYAGSGGGIATVNNLTVIGSTIRDNIGINEGGGIWTYNYKYSHIDIDIINSTISTNWNDSTWENYGGLGSGIYAESTDEGSIDINVNSSTIAFNHIYGLYFLNRDKGVHLDIKNSILAHSTILHEEYGTYSDVIFCHYMLCTDNSLPLNWADDSDMMVTPYHGLGPLGYYGGTTQVHPLLAGSDAIDRIPFDSNLYGGDDEEYHGASQIDQIGQSVYNNMKDLGAFENQIGGRVFYADGDTGSDSNDGSIGSPWKTLSHSIDSLYTDDVLNISGTFLLDQDPGITDSTGLNIHTNTLIKGQGKDNTFIKAHSNPGMANSRVMTLGEFHTIQLEDFTVMNGNANLGGAGIYIGKYDSVYIKNVDIKNCNSYGPPMQSKEGVGGGLCTYAYFLSASNLNISDCYASIAGGGIYNKNNLNTILGTTLFDSLSVSGCVSDKDGGGIFNETGNMNISNSTIINCDADEYGGGLYHFQGDFYLGESSVSECTGGYQGGGFYHRGSYNFGNTMTFENTTINNCSAYYGGAISLRGSNNTDDLSLTNCTLSSNYANDGPALHCYASGSTLPTNINVNINSCTISVQNLNRTIFLYESDISDGLIDVDIKNSIFDNTISSFAYESGSNYSLTRSYTICSDSSMPITGEGNLNNTDPMLDILRDNDGIGKTHALYVGSPALNAISSAAGGGNYNDAPLLDQRGVAIINTNKDIGAYEGWVTVSLDTPVITDVSYDGNVWLTWDPVSGATGYAIYSSADPYGDFVLEGSTVAGTNNWNKTFAEGRYFFYVTALDSKGFVNVPKKFSIERSTR